MAAGVRVDDVGITYPGARAIPAIFNLFQVPFRGGEKRGAIASTPAQRDTSILSPLPSPHLIPRPISRIRHG